MTLNITNFDAKASSNSASQTATAATLLGTATATATSMLMMQSPTYRSYTPIMIGAGVGMAAAAAFGTVDAAQCPTPSVTITLPILDGDRIFNITMPTARVLGTPTCPTGWFYHPINGCSPFRSTYTRVWSSSPACEAAVPATMFVTSAQGNVITLDDNSMMVPFIDYQFISMPILEFDTVLQNGQRAHVKAWTAKDKQQGMEATA